MQEVFVQFLLLLVLLVALGYAVFRVTRAVAIRPRTRTIGPDDDPDFLRRLGSGPDAR